MRPYPLAAGAAVAAAVGVDQRLLGTRLLRRRSFWTAYGIMLAGQLAANGVLTGRRVVVYDERVIAGPRLAAAPVEDLGVGFALVTATLAGWVAAGRRERARTPAARWPAAAAAAR